MSGSKEQDQVLSRLVGYHVRIAQLAIFRDFVTSLKDYDMTPTQFGTLTIINSNPGISQSQLAKTIKLDRSSVVPMIDRLENEGYVIREKLVSDRRANALKLTENGEKLLSSLFPLVHEHESRLVENLTKDEQKQLVSLLDKIFPNLN